MKGLKVCRPGASAWEQSPSPCSLVKIQDVIGSSVPALLSTSSQATISGISLSCTFVFLQPNRNFPVHPYLGVMYKQSLNSPVCTPKYI